MSEKCFGLFLIPFLSSTCASLWLKVWELADGLSPLGGDPARGRLGLTPIEKYGCWRHCTAVGLLFGSQAHIAVIRSMASGQAFVMILERGVAANWGKRKFMEFASFSPSAQFCWVGVPITLHTNFG